MTFEGFISHNQFFLRCNTTCPICHRHIIIPIPHNAPETAREGMYRKMYEQMCEKYERDMRELRKEVGLE